MRRARSNASGRCAASSSIQSLPQPILAHELVDPREFTLIIRNDPISECDGLSGDQQVVAANRCAGVFEPSADLAVNRIGGRPARVTISSAPLPPTLAPAALRSLFFLSMNRER